MPDRAGDSAITGSDAGSRVGQTRRIDALAARIAELEAINRHLERRLRVADAQLREAAAHLADARSALGRLEDYVAVEQATRGWRALAATRRLRSRLGLRGRVRSQSPFR